MAEKHVFERAVDVAGDVQVEPAVPVGIEEGGRRVPARRLDADPRRDVLEAPAAKVAVEHVAAEVRDQDVGPAVVVVVGDRRARSPFALASDAGAVRHVLESAVGALVIEGVLAPLDDPRAVEPPAVDEVDVESAVPVVVEERRAGPRRVEEVILLGPSRLENAGDAQPSRDVDESKTGRWRRYRLDRSRLRSAHGAATRDGAGAQQEQ